MLDDIIEEERGTVTPDSALVDLLGWDSLAVLSFIAAADERMGKTLSGKEVEECETVGDLLKLVGDSVE